MEAVVIEGFKGVPDGETQVAPFAEGDLVGGDLAKVAVENGWAKETQSSDPEAKAEAEAKAKAEAENKVKAAPQNKAASQPASKGG